jgi:pimeloyl-ACP methyl ester carboxylesterase
MTAKSVSHVVAHGDIQLHYETFGHRGGETVLLLCGAGRQGQDYSDAFCDQIATAGFRVIRYDARDTGLSSALSDRPSKLVEVYDAVKAGRRPPLAYGLEDLAADAFAILDADGAGATHLFARSLGSGVAQLMALAQPERIASLMLVIAFSRSLADTLSREGLERIESESFVDADAYVARQIRSAMTIGSPAYFDEARVAAEARIAFARGVHPGGSARHFAAGIAAPDLRPRLGALKTPALIVHGALDKVIPLTYAQETAASLVGSRLEVMDDMGHDGPPTLQRRWLGLFLDHVGAV